MNVVLRVKTSERSFILKQSRPYVEKYQQIEAPLDRIDVEHQFYKNITNHELKAHIPIVHNYNASEHIMLLQDLGQCQDMTYIYERRKIEPKNLLELIKILNTIHGKGVPKLFPKNMGLRQLNHQHIFVLPFMEENGFQLDNIQNGLQELSSPYKTDITLKMVVEEIGEKYLQEGKVLLHGDYYPGSWMTESNNIYVIDPEFSFVGFAEFDLGVMIAHLTMASLKDDFTGTILKQYQHKIDAKLVQQVAGIEMMRRLIGLAQLPLPRTIKEKGYLLQVAKKMILS
ncbi:MAG: hypothetical protein COA50_00830 [Flavobacteriaceae bacterium]|nr:MAG: hypothetical protein COA50_00830 [Flavobacteriaceae bacterium]